jgi:hypothetical protein
MVLLTHLFGISVCHQPAHPGVTSSGPVWSMGVVSSFFFFPTFGKFTTAIIGHPTDNRQDLWNTWHSQIALASDPRQLLFTRQLFFPEGTSLVYHSFAYVNLIGIFVLRSIFGLSLSLNALVGLHNLMLLLSFYFGAIGAFALTWQFTRHFLSSLIGGYIFAFSPFHFAHSLTHMNVATVQFISFFALYMLRYMESQLIRFYIGLVVFFVLGALSCWYYLFYNAYFLLFYYVYYAVRKRAPLLKAPLMQIAAILAGAFVALSPLILPMIREGIGNPSVEAEMQ